MSPVTPRLPTARQLRLAASLAAIAAAFALTPAQAQVVRGGGGGGHGAVAGGGGGAAAVHAGGGRFGGGHWGGDRWGGDFRGTVADGHAWHHRGWRGFGAGVWGGPYFDDWYDDAADVPSPYYGAPAYPAAPPPQIAGYWYYCASPQGYYPYVQQCSVAWQPVPPQG